MFPKKLNVFVHPFEYPQTHLNFAAILFEIWQKIEIILQ